MHENWNTFTFQNNTHINFIFVNLLINYNFGRRIKLGCTK